MNDYLQERNILGKCFSNISAENRKPLLIFWLTRVLTDLMVPLTGQFSNSFYENLSEIYDLRKVLISEGLMDNNGFILTATEIQGNSNIPYGN